MNSKSVTKVRKNNLSTKKLDKNLQEDNALKQLNHLLKLSTEQAIKNVLDKSTLDTPLDELIYKIVEDNSHMPTQKRDLSLEHPHYVILASLTRYTELLRQEVLSLKKQIN